MFKLTDENFESEVLGSDLPVLVDFFATWCGLCRMVGPVIEELVEEYKGKIKVGKLNVDKSPKVAQKYGVMSVPTLIIFRGGKEVKRLVGLQSKENLVKELEI